MVCSIQSIFQEAEAFLPIFPWVSPKIHWKPEGMHPKNFCFIVICFLQAFIEPWEPNDRLHGIPGDDPQVGEPENAAKRGLEIHVGRTAPKIRNHVDTAHARIYDRLLEMCVPVSCIGVSFRKENAQEKLERLKILIG